MKKVSGVDNTITGFVLGIILIYEKWVCGKKNTKKSHMLRFISEWHGYILRPLRGHIRDTKMRKITITITS